MGFLGIPDFLFIEGIYTYFIEPVIGMFLLRISIFTFSGLQPDVVEKLVGLREGIPRKDAKEVSSKL